MKNKKRLTIITSIFFIILLIGILYTTYGFIGRIVTGNETSKKAVFNSQILEVTFSDGEETLTSTQEKFIPGSTITKTFTITNTGNVPVKYSINLSDVVNDFERYYDLTYSIESSDGSINESGVFPQKDTYLVSKDTLEKSESETYTLTINYLPSEENQIVDSGKTINAKIIIDETIKKISKLLVYGNSIQDVRTGKNLFNVSNANIIGGYLSANKLNNYEDTLTKIIVIPCDANTTYTVSREIIGARFAVASSPNAPATDIAMTKQVNGSDKSSITITTGASDQYLYVWFYNANYDTEYTYQQLMEKIQIEKGSTATEYEGYGIKPTPDNPSEIKSLGEKTVNMFDRENFITTFTPYQKVAPSIETFKGKDCLKVYGDIDVNGRSIKYMQGQFKENTQYTFSFKYIDVFNGESFSGIRIVLNYTDGTTSAILSVRNSESEDWSEKIFTSTSGKSIDYISLTYNYGVPYTYFYDFQIQEGTIATEYEPYNKYKISVMSNSKNLFNKNDVNYLIGYLNKNVTTITTHANARSIYIPCEPNTTYTVSRNSTNSQFHLGYTNELPKVGVPVYGVNGTADTNIKSLTITTGTDAKYLVTYVYNGYSSTTDFWDEIIDGLQIEKGDKATAYESPYTTKIYLDEPLRKIGDCENCYDVVSLNEKTLKTNTEELVLTGTETYFKYSTYNTYYINDLPARYEDNVLTLSNYYMGQVSGAGSTYKSGNIWLQSNEQYPRLYMSDDSYTTVDAFKTHLSDLYAANTPVKLYYRLGTTSTSTIDTIEILNEVVPKNSDKISICSENGVCASKIEIEYDE